MPSPISLFASLLIYQALLKRIKSRKPNVFIVSPSSHYKINVWNSKILYTVPIRTTKTTTVIVNNHEEALELHNNNEESIGHETNETITEENDDLGFDSALVSSFNGSRKGGWKYNLVSINNILKKEIIFNN